MKFFGNIKEQTLYLLLLFFTALVYLVNYFYPHSVFFGFNQIKTNNFSQIALFFLYFAILFFLYGKIRKKYIFFIIASLSFFALFLIFKSNFINQDGKDLCYKIFYEVVPAQGYFVTLDEIGEHYIHSKFWYITNKLFNWSTVLSYQVLSSVAGAFFIFFLLLFSEKNFPGKSINFFIAVISGAFMQMFFGDVENYSMVSALIIIYLYSSYLYLESKKSVIVPSGMLALAICFHLLAGWLIPGLLYLYYLSFKRKHFKEMIIGIFIFAMIIICILIFIHLQGAPLKKLFYRSGFYQYGIYALNCEFTNKIGNQSNNIIEIFLSFAYNIIRFFNRDTFAYYLDIFNLLYLIFPAVPLLIPLILYKKIPLSAFNIFMAISSIFMLAYMLLWKARLGVYNDWNLFAPCAIPFSIFCWYNFFRISQNELSCKMKFFYLYVSLSIIHTYSWIISNHDIILI